MRVLPVVAIDPVPPCPPTTVIIVESINGGGFRFCRERDDRVNEGDDANVCAWMLRGQMAIFELLAIAWRSASILSVKSD